MFRHRRTAFVFGSPVFPMTIPQTSSGYPSSAWAMIAFRSCSASVILPPEVTIHILTQLRELLMPHAQTDVLPPIIAEDHHDVALFHPMRHPDGDMNDCTGRDARKDPLFRCQILRGRKGATGVNHNLAVQQAGVKDRRDEALVQAAKPLNQIARVGLDSDDLGLRVDLLQPTTDSHKRP